MNRLKRRSCVVESTLLLTVVGRGEIIEAPLFTTLDNVSLRSSRSFFFSTSHHSQPLVKWQPAQARCYNLLPLEDTAGRQVPTEGLKGPG